MIEMVLTTMAPRQKAVATNTNESKNISILNTLVIERGACRIYYASR
jgi:hypothetical protein